MDTDTMRRFYGITLDKAQKLVLYEGAFGYWNAPGNYMNAEIPADMQNAETWVFLGKSIFIFGVSAEKDNIKMMVSLTDFIDIWPSVKIKYSQLFQDEVKGDFCLIL